MIFVPRSSATPRATLRAAGLTALLAAAGAHAQGTGNLTIYGLFDAAVRQASNASTRGTLRTMEDGIFTGSRLGVRGREDLGGGLTAVFTIESGFDPSTGLSLQSSPTADYGQVASTTRFWGREAHLGLRGSWGALTVGRQYTLAHSFAARFQPLGNPNSTAHSLFSSHHIARQDNQLRVDTTLGPVELAASHTFGEQTAASANGSWAIAAGTTRPTYAVGAYVQRMNNPAGTEARRIVGAGGNLRLSPTVALYGGVMQRSAEVSRQKNRAWTLGANVELSPSATLSAAFYDDDQSGSTALEGSRRVLWITANYRFSRRTDVYAVIDQNRVGGGYARPAFMGTVGTQTGVAAGLRHRF